MAWMNVDRPTKKLTIHLSGNRWVRGMRTIRWKGVHNLRRDGGWLTFANLAAALNQAQAN